MEFKCGYADQSHDIHKGISRFLKNTNDSESALVFFDYGIKNGYKMPTPTDFNRTFGVIQKIR